MRKFISYCLDHKTSLKKEGRVRSEDALVFVNSNIGSMVVIKLGVMFQYLQACVVRHIFVVERELPPSTSIHYNDALQDEYIVVANGCSWVVMEILKSGNPPCFMSTT